MDTINQSQSLSKAKNALLVYFLFKTLGWIWFKILLIIRQFRLFGIKGASQKFYKQSFQSLIILVRKTVPSAQRMVQKEIDDSVAQIHKGMLSKGIYD